MRTWRTPRNAEPTTSAELHVLLAVATEYQAHRRVTVRAVADRCGRSIATTWATLDRLERDGLVVHEPGRDATLRPLVAVVSRFG